jgi:hypothetical protein
MLRWIYSISIIGSFSGNIKYIILTIGRSQVGLQHNLGLGGACVITLYKKPAEWASVAPKRKFSGAMGFDGEGAAPKARL